MAGIFSIPLALGIWLPDVFIDREHTLAQERLPSGHSFHVIQYWNHGDFYNTELVHIAPDGRRETRLLDPDDGKRWRALLTVDGRARLAIVELSGRRARTFTWATEDRRPPR